MTHELILYCHDKFSSECKKFYRGPPKWPKGWLERGVFIVCEACEKKAVRESKKLGDGRFNTGVGSGRTNHRVESKPRPKRTYVMSEPRGPRGKYKPREKA